MVLPVDVDDAIAVQVPGSHVEDGGILTQSRADDHPGITVGQVREDRFEIRRRQLAGRQGLGSFESAGLANEAYLKLARAGGIGCENRSHFLALCAQVMRRILVDHVRERASAKRGGRAVRLALDDIPMQAPGHGVDVLALDEALQRLARLDPRKSRVVELRYFGGLTIEETAEVLGASIDIVKRDWRMARAWLLRELLHMGQVIQSHALSFFHLSAPDLLLGFDRDPIEAEGWSFLTRDNFKVMLGECANEKPASELGDHSYFVYLTVDSLDEYYREIAARGAKVHSEPKDKPWGMREFGLSTPDGHRITCGEAIKR